MYKSANKDENGAEVTFKDSGEEGSNISSRSFKYLRPYAILKTNNDVYDGYTWQKAHYLNPVPVREMELLSPDEKQRHLYCIRILIGQLRLEKWLKNN